LREKRWIGGEKFWLAVRVVNGRFPALIEALVGGVEEGATNNRGE